MRFVGVGAVVIAVAGCNPNFGGQGTASSGTPLASSGTDDGGSAEATASVTTGGVTTSGGSMSVDETSADPTTTTPGTTTSVGTTGPDPTTGPGEEETGEPTCPPPVPFSQLVMAADAVVEAPAERREAWGILSGNPQVAYSFVGEQGLIHFDFDVPCEGTYHVWGLVWDLHRGGGFSCGTVENADSLYVHDADAPGTEQLWAWGCNSCEWRDQTWDWARATEYVTNPCVVEDISYDWSPGIHRITFRNQSTGWDGGTLPDVAAVAAVVVSDDPTFDPATLYAP